MLNLYKLSFKYGQKLPDHEILFNHCAYSIELQMHNVDIGFLGFFFFLLLICIILHMNSSEILLSGCFKVIIRF